MRIAVGFGGPATQRADWRETLEFAVECDRLGVDFCWSAEAWGQDAIAPLAYVAARTERALLGTGILQISARVPAMTAMTALTMATLTDDRFVLGLGVSGPQVVEGLHGVPFAAAYGRMREYLDVLRAAFAGDLVEYDGKHYTIPYPGGEGKRLRVTTEPVAIPVYLASLGPKMLELTGERADGWLGTCFLPEAASVLLDPIRRGAERAGRTLADLDLQAGGFVAFGDDQLDTVRRRLAFRLGAMGSREHNFYNDAYQRAGYADQAAEVQRLWMAGRRDAARSAVTEEMVRISSLLGTDEDVCTRLRAYRDAGITTFRVHADGATVTERMDTVARVRDLAASL